MAPFPCARTWFEKMDAVRAVCNDIIDMGGGGTLINKEIANEFVDNLEEFSAYQISILDEFGTVISSTNPEYVGETADIVSVDKKHYPVIHEMKDQEGVIASIIVEHHLVGYFEIMGCLSEVKSIAKIIRMAMEIRLKYDINAKKDFRALTNNEKLIRQLVNGKEISKKEVLNLFDTLKYEPNLTRTLLILVPEQKSFMDSLANMNLYYDSNQDIVAPYQNTVVVLKDTSKIVAENFIEYKKYLRRYIVYIRNNTVFSGNAFISLPQSDFRMFSANYRQVFWLNQHLPLFADEKSDGIYLLRDYLDYYFKGRLIENTYHDYFETILQHVKPFDKEEFIIISQTLIANNYNLSQSSKDLFMHKNTLIYKIEKIKKMFDIDPINRETDRCFLRNLCYYLRYCSLIERDRHEGD